MEQGQSTLIAAVDNRPVVVFSRRHLDIIVGMVIVGPVMLRIDVIIIGSMIGCLE